MASIKSHNGKWRAFIFKDGVRKTKVFPVKAQAVAWANKIEGDILAGKTNTIPNRTFGELLTDYAEKVSVTKKGVRWEQIRIELIKRDDIANIKIADLNKSHFAEWRDRRLKEVMPSSVRREWVLLSSAIKVSINEWGWLKDNPMKGVKIPNHSEHRDRLITDDELKRLAHVFGSDVNTVMGRVGQAFLFAIETAMRAGEIANLTWDNVNLNKKFLSTRGKTAAAKRDVPLSPKAIEILKGIGTQDGRVFNLKSSQIDSLFRKAKNKAVIDDLHFHDSRHQAITNLAKQLDVLELARSVGHRDLKMLMIYYNETAEVLANKLS